MRRMGKEREGRGEGEQRMRAIGLMIAGSRPGLCLREREERSRVCTFLFVFVRLSSFLRSHLQ